MKFTRTFKNTLLFLIALSSFGVARAQIDLDFDIHPIAAKEQNHFDCGVEVYSRRDPLCGAVYNAKASSFCPKAGYNTRPHLSCPGSIKAKVYRVKKKSKCKAGETKRITKVKWKKRRGLRKLLPTTVYDYHCVATQKLKSCALKAFGIKYKTCRHKNHGVQNYKTCKNPNFLPKKPAKCSMFVNSDELSVFMDQTKESINVMSSSRLAHMSSYMRVKKLKKQMACTIKKVSSIPELSADADKMQEEYEMEFLEDFDGDQFDCRTGSRTDIATTIEDECVNQAGVAPVQCESGLAFLKVKRWFDVQKTNFSNIKTQMNITSQIEEEMTELEDTFID